MDARTLSFRNIDDYQPCFKFGQDVWYVEGFAVRHCKVCGIRRLTDGFWYELLEEGHKEVMERNSSYLYDSEFDALIEAHGNIVSTLIDIETRLKRLGGAAFCLKSEED